MCAANVFGLRGIVLACACTLSGLGYFQACCAFFRGHVLSPFFHVVRGGALGGRRGR